MPVYRNEDGNGYNQVDYLNANGKNTIEYEDHDKTITNRQLNNNQMTIEQLIDFVQADLTFSGMLPKVLPDVEIERIIREQALQWFYKNYQQAVIKSYYRLDRSFINHETYTKMGFIVMPEECENIVKIYNINDASIFRFGIQNPNLSISFGTSSTPYLTSYVSSVSELAGYKAIIDSFSDELNKMSKLYNKYAYNTESKRLNLLGEVRNSLMLECYIHIEAEELFQSQLFKNFVTATSQIRQGKLLTRYEFSMPGGFKLNGAELITQGQELLDKTIEEVKASSPSTAFFIMAK